MTSTPRYGFVHDSINGKWTIIDWKHCQTVGFAWTEQGALDHCATLNEATR